MSSERPPSIQCAKNGPYLVKNLEQFTNSFDEQIPTKETIALCRCGASKNKPYCDGSHDRIGFSNQKRDGRVKDQRDEYEGEAITIYDNRGTCSHAGFCTSGCPAVWRTNTEPWIDADGTDVETIVKTIQQCPSGALSYAIDGKEHRDQERESELHVSKDGPYCVRGGVDLQGVEWGEGASREHYTLCRCGGSKNKPFCDGTHWYIDFKDDESKTHGVAAQGAQKELKWYLTGNEDGAKHCAMNILYSLQHLGYVIPPQADADWLGEAGPGPSYLDPGSGGPENDFTNRNTTFMAWNLLHMARMIRDAGGIPAHGNQRSQWDAGCRSDFSNPAYR